MFLVLAVDVLVRASRLCTPLETRSCGTFGAVCAAVAGSCSNGSAAHCCVVPLNKIWFEHRIQDELVINQQRTLFGKC